MAFPEDEIILVSAIPQYAYCPRRCALIHVEQQFNDNPFTIQGSHLHTRADLPIATTRTGVRIERAVSIWSEVYGLRGRADVIEVGEDGSICPVEYKRGRRRADLPSDEQLCAQTLCLEEMLGISITMGAVYYHESRRRQDVNIDEKLRQQTIETIKQIRNMLNSGRTPPPVFDARCPNCSLGHICQPAAITHTRQIKLDDLYQAKDETEG